MQTSTLVTASLRLAGLTLILSTMLLDRLAVSESCFETAFLLTFLPVQPIMIASIMMQESSCNKDTVGGGGEQGLMQITHDKCGGAPNGDCKEPVRIVVVFYRPTLTMFAVVQHPHWRKIPREPD